MITNPIRSLVVDDEVAARRLLLRLLGNHPEISVVAEASSVDQAAELCGRLKPELVFLDVQMPQKGGFDLLELLPERPVVVFVTAHLDYTLKAFELGSCDYLLKPVSAERLAITVARLTALWRGPAQPEAPAPDRLGENDKLVLPLGSAMVQIQVAEIALIEADGAYTKVTLLSGETHLLLRGISQWEKMLPVARFARISRFQILNCGAVRRFERRNIDESWVSMQGVATALALSRRATVRLRSILRDYARSCIKIRTFVR